MFCQLNVHRENIQTDLKTLKCIILDLLSYDDTSLQEEAAAADTCLAMVSCSSSFLAPTTLSTILPSFKKRKVGMASMEYSSATG